MLLSCVSATVSRPSPPFPLFSVADAKPQHRQSTSQWMPLRLQMAPATQAAQFRRDGVERQLCCCRTSRTSNAGFSGMRPTGFCLEALSCSVMPSRLRVVTHTHFSRAALVAILDIIDLLVVPVHLVVLVFFHPSCHSYSISIILSWHSCCDCISCHPRCCRSFCALKDLLFR